MKNKHLAIIGVAAMVFASQSAMAQYFTNDLKDAVNVAANFNENLGPDGMWSYTNDYALAQDGTTNTVLQGGAVLGLAPLVTNDTDNARSYLATVHSNYADKSWTAHVAVETANVDPKNFIFFGLGQGVPNPGQDYQPTLGDYVHIQWASGHVPAKVRVVGSNGAFYDSGAWQGDPGYDIWMHYDHINQLIYYEIDNWNGGRTNGVNITTTPVSTAGLTNSMSIYFGGNATMTFGDFDVYAAPTNLPPPAPILGFYSYPITPTEVVIGWDPIASAGSYVVKRADESGGPYTTVVSNLVDTVYTNGGVSADTYYYVVSSVNSNGEGNNSVEQEVIVLPYTIIGTDSTWQGNPALTKHNLFDEDVDTFFDGFGSGGWAGLDFGAGNAQQIYEIQYTLRSWSSHAYNAATNNAVFQASNDPTFTSYTELHVAPTNISIHPAVNTVVITDTNEYRYVRLTRLDGAALNFMAETRYITGDDFTTNGTPKYWLDSYYDVDVQFSGNYEAADTSETDGDGALAWEEYLAGTIPTDSNSVLRIISGSLDGSDFIVTWQSVEGKSYSVITNADLSFPNPGVSVSGIAGEAGQTSITSSIPALDNLFMEIGVE